MPYSRRTSYAKRTRKVFRRRFKKRPNIISTVGRNVGAMTVGQAARYAARGVSIMKGIINSEMKRFTNNNTVNPSTTGTILHLSSIAQGDDVADRNGNSLLAKYLTYNWQVQMNASATATVTRVIVFVDTESTGGTPPTAAQLLQSPNNTISPINSDYTQRFTILFDDTIDTSINANRILNRKHYIPLNFHIKYTGSSGTNYDKNQIFMYHISNEGTNVPNFDYFYRIAFYDN